MDVVRTPISLIFKALLVVALLAPSFVRGETDAAAEAARQMEITLRVHTILRETTYRAENGGEPLGDAAMTSLLQDSARRILEAYAAQGLPEPDKARAWNLLGKLDWRAMVDNIRNIGPGLLKTVRTQGVPAAAGIVLGTVLDVAVPVALTAVGAPYLIPVSVVIPYQPLLYGAAVGVQQKLQQQRLIRLYGDPETYRETQRQYQEVRKALGTRGLKDILVPLLDAEGKSHVAVLRQRGFLGRLLERFGWAEKSLSFASLRSFVRRHGIEDGYLRAILADTGASQEAKAVLILHHLATMEDRAPLVALRREHANSFRELALPAGLRDLEAWAAKFAGVKDLGRVHRLFDEAPTNVPARAVVRVWREILLPAVMEQVEGLSGRELRALRDNSLALLAEAEKSPGNWSPRWGYRVHGYLRESVPDARCHRHFARLTALAR